jgi:transcriptional regulator with XRE-family HTH domain
VSAKDVTPEELGAMRAALPAPARRREIRLAAGGSQAVVAEMVGVTRISVLWWEREGPQGTSPSDANLPGYFRALVELEQAARENEGPS